MLKYILKLIFPERCIFCGIPTKLHSRQPYICEDCAKNIPYAGSALSAPYKYETLQGLAVFRYSSVRDTIFLFKYNGYIHYGRILGKMMADYILNNNVDYILDADMIIPVPLWKSKEKKRGFNQAAVLAEAIAKKIGKNYDKDMLIRIRNTKSQNRLNKNERRENIHDAFAISKGHSAENKSIVIVDDIYTTGITIYECARPLFAAGARDVFFLALSTPIDANNEDYEGGNLIQTI